MGIEGAALATGIGQIVTVIIYISIYIIKPIPVKIRRNSFIYQKEMAMKLYSIGIPAALNLALPSLLVSSLNAILTGYSQIYVVVLGVYYKLQTFLYLPANGIVQGMRPLIGYNYGAKEYKRVKQIYITSLLLTVVIMVFGTFLCFIIPEQLIGLFTTNNETVQAGAFALRIISIGFIISSISVVSSGALEGLGMGIPSFVISVLSLCANYSSIRFFIQFLNRSNWYMACFLDYRIFNRCCILFYLSQRNESQVKQLTCDFITITKFFPILYFSFDKI